MEARQYGTKINNSQMPLRHRKIHILTIGSKTITSYKFYVYYDLIKSSLIANLRTMKKTYKSESVIKLKLYIWYTLTITWDELDGLRIYINNRLLDHNIGIRSGTIEDQESKHL